MFKALRASQKRMCVKFSRRSLVRMGWGDGGKRREKWREKETEKTKGGKIGVDLKPDLMSREGRVSEERQKERRVQRGKK